MKSLNTPVGLLAIYGKRGVGKSSLLRQVQQMALGNYTLVKRAGLSHLIPNKPRRFLTVYYSCDSMIRNGEDLLKRLCNDQNPEDGLLRLVPDDGKELVEFSRAAEIELGADLKVIKWGTKGVESSRYARVVDNDTVQTFRNFVSAIVTHQVQGRMKRDGLLILLDEFDVLKDKTGLGSLIKSLTSSDVKFGICGIGRDLTDLVEDHASVERLLEEGAVHVQPMPSSESRAIISTAERLFKGGMSFSETVANRIAEISRGYPYFVQLLGKECVSQANARKVTAVDDSILEAVLEDVKAGRAFPTLEAAYQRAIGNSTDRQLLLHLLADQPENTSLYTEDVGRIFLREARKDAEGLDVQYIDQLMPRLVEEKYGPVLARASEKQGVYEFVNPVFRLYVSLRAIE